MTVMPRQLYLATVDEYLGAAERRFFGSGYRRATYRVAELAVTPTGGAGPVVTAKVTVDYPADWSKKKDEIDVPPHLSSIDTLLLSVQLAEAHLAHGLGLGPGQRRQARLRRVKLIAGPVPQEELSELPASVSLRGSKPLPGDQDTWASVYESRIGAMRARCEIAHPASAPGGQQARFPLIEDALGPAKSRYYGAGFALRVPRLTDVTADTESYVATGSVSMGSVPVTPDGIEGALQPVLSPVDCFVTSLQFGQVLMYAMDDIKRSESNTLWMMQTSLDLTGPRVGLEPDKGYVARTEVTAAHVLPLHGKPWRNTEISGSLGGIGLRCSLAHELPEIHGTTTRSL